jgi:hypothetical protein
LKVNDESALPEVASRSGSIERTTGLPACVRAAATKSTDAVAGVSVLATSNASRSDETCSVVRLLSVATTVTLPHVVSAAEAFTATISRPATTQAGNRQRILLGKKIVDGDAAIR